MNNGIKSVAFAAALLLLSCFYFSTPASAQTSTPKPAATKSPGLTAEQKAYVKARDKCLQRYTDEKIPRSQTHTFLNACMKEAGFSKAVPVPNVPPPPPQPSKSTGT